MAREVPLGQVAKKWADRSWDCSDMINVPLELLRIRAHYNARR